MGELQGRVALVTGAGGGIGEACVRALTARGATVTVAYVITKHALEGLSKVVAAEGGPRGVTSNYVNPGYVRAALVEQQFGDQATAHGISDQEGVETALLKRSAIKRLIEPTDVGELVAWFTSDAASMATGASWVMDGGCGAR